MSTPENPESGQLTRRQMRQQRTTGSTPIIGSTAVATQEPPPLPPLPKAPLPRAARPVAVAPAPGPDASVDLGVSPLTRRQARQQERIRTASVPVITPDVMAAHAASTFAPPAVVPEPEPVLWTAEIALQREADAAAAALVDVPVTAEIVPEPDAEADAAVVDDAPVDEAPVTAEVVAEPDEDDAGVESEEWSAPVEDVAEVAVAAPIAQDPAESAAEEPWLDPSEAEPESAAPQVDPRFGDHLLAVEQPADVDADADAVSFDDLLTHETGSGGTGATPHALILSHVPEASPLSAVTSTGEVIVTGIYNLPDGLGSQGHAHGAADGKEVDSILLDGELPASSSPTPIAASAAISTVRNTGEIIRPPAPDKSNRWVMVLAITAGALALALVITLAIAVGTGAFN